MDTLSSIWNILKVALGLGFVVFIHELGHFLLAKWNGVKVEKFSIGFGKTIFGFQRGETEYVLAAIPLGGFVKMLGEGTEEEGGGKSTDPRSFSNKSVGARMAIISAGVIMNLILGLGCFAYAFGQEREKLLARVGEVIAGSPAYEVGLRPGDNIVGIDGSSADIGFQDLNRVVNLSSQGQVIVFHVQRPEVEKTLDFAIQPRREGASDRPMIGVMPGLSLHVVGYQPPAGTVDPPTFPWAAKSADPMLETIVAAGPVGEPSVALSDYEAFRILSARNREKPMEITIEHQPAKPKEGASTPERVSVVLPPNHIVDFGFRLGVEPIRSIQKDSPAQAAGFRVGDRIVKVDGRDDFDPMRLATECFDHAGSPMTFEVQRTESGEATPKTVTLTVTPAAAPPTFNYGEIVQTEDFEVSSLGLCFPIRTTIEAVRPDSPAAKAGLKPGDVINAITVPKTKGRSHDLKSGGQDVWLSSREQTYRFDDNTAAWPFAFSLVQSFPLQDVGLTINKAEKPVSIKPEIVPDWFDSDRGLELWPATRTMPPLAPLAALKEGLNETIDNVSAMYAMIRSLFSGRVSPKNLGGPILIAQVAYSAADSGLGAFLSFLGFISINLAVLNFLPIPPLDGGQMVFLLAEKVRGRPLPDSALIAGTYVGLLLVLCLMVFATYQDVFRLLTRYFF
ncbi:M50 family metallopeptidase [Paludisphaera borealis]|uniref:Zinc metalloprotease n=1 Tax=Paludisphaera borealis TaxID=1387353 RepID=A0A1U7CWK4_9BACT|nr:M50 family metallopeptidase [Paludisphaera borealis]APW63278.1 Putative zinc metalloprotease [Paludisphaera borealis]